MARPALTNRDAMTDQNSPALVETSFPTLLRGWRRRRRLSQLDLSLTSGVSQRHLSFLESGRANPSRNMILQLSEALDVPLRDRNSWLTAAGFAPVFRARALDDPQMALVMSAVQMMLVAHEPYPALALDRAWNITRSNSAFDRLIKMVGDDVWVRVGGAQPNLLRLFFHPQGIRTWVSNWASVGPLVWRRAQKEAEAVGGQGMAEVLDALSPYQDAQVLWSAMDVALVPILPFNLQMGAVCLSMFALVSTFGTAQDVTADELRIETLWPADPETEGLFKAMAGGA